jgi:signal transduction histidine kinase/CheY-like chemotaxis protein
VALGPLSAAISPETGIPVFQHYTSDQYNAGPQNWGITQDRRGVMYFGNTAGVLEFDGSSWRTIRMKNGLLCRSLALGEDARVYVGGRADFGFLDPDAHGELQFHSLLDRVPAQDRSSFADVWRVLATPEGIYFSAYSRLFRLNKDGSIHVWRPTRTFGRAIYILNALYVVTPEQGLMRMGGDNLVPAPGGEQFAKIPIADAIAVDGAAILAAGNTLFRMDASGVQPFPTGADSLFAKNPVYTLRLLPTGEIGAALGAGGLVLIDRTGTLDRFIEKGDGLPDEFVKYIFVDRQDGVWLSSANGIARMEPGLSRFDAVTGISSDILCVARANGTVYAGGASGVFRMETVPGRTPRFAPVAGISGQVPVLVTRGDSVFALVDGVGVDFFEISGSRATRRAQLPAAYDFSFSPTDPTVVYVAAPGRVYRLRIGNGAWRKDGEFTASAAEEFRGVGVDREGRVWAGSRNFFWLIDFNSTPPHAEKFGPERGAPTAPGALLSVTRLSHDLAFATPKGLRSYSPERKQFVLERRFGNDFADGSRDTVQVFDSPSGEVWVSGNSDHDLLMPGTGGYSRIHMPLQSAQIRILYAGLAEDSHIFWAIGAKDVLYRWDGGAAADPNRDFHVLTRAVEDIAGNARLYGGAGAFAGQRLPWEKNSLRFEFSAPYYEDPAAVEYQVQLVGSDRGWLPWSHENRKDYTNLREGGYRFQVRARNPHGLVSEAAALEFTVLPPWYRAWWACLAYALSLGFGVWQLLRFRTAHLTAANLRLEGIVADRTAQLELKRAEAEKATQAKSEFLAKMSHEIRTPLNAVIGMADVLASGALTADQKKCVDVSQRNGIGLLNLINDILDLAKVESGKVELETTGFDLREVVTGAIEVVERRVSAKGLWLRQTIDPAVPIYLRGDPNRLRQVLINLLGNSIKFTETGGLEVRVTLDPESNAAGCLRFAVADTGIGIPSDKVDAVFESFSQADASTTRKYGGTGLGLTISRQLVELMQGRIWLESTVGVGTTFFFTARLEADENQTERREEKSQVSMEALAQRLVGMRILLADDSEDNRFLVTSYLNGLRCAIDQAGDGAEALGLFERNRYDVVLMDGEMPVMDGFTATREIRLFEKEQNREPVPVLAFTAHAFADMAAKALAGGFSGVLTKPIRKITLIEALAKHGKDIPPGLSAEPEKIRIVPDEDMRDVVPAYLEKRKTEIALYRKALAENDLKSIAALAHKMKGTGAGYGFPVLTEMGASIEQSAKQNRPQDLAAQIEALEGYLNKIEIEENALD